MAWLASDRLDGILSLAGTASHVGIRDIGQVDPPGLASIRFLRDIGLSSSRRQSASPRASLSQIH